MTGNNVSYDLQVSTSLQFEPNNIVVDITGIEDAKGVVEKRIDASQLRGGEHYVRLTARASNEPERFWQVADNRLERNGTRYYGVLQFSVP